MPLRLAIVGRPNVGKSTLFNRLVGKRLAIVHDTPGVTRDWRAAEAALGGLAFTVIDTAGLEEADAGSLEGRMLRQTEQALDEADVALLVIDARVGVTPVDRHFADWLRRRRIPILLAANKCESRAANAGLLEAWELGLGEPIALSAEHGEGLADLVEALLPHVEAAEAAEAALAALPEPDPTLGSDPEAGLEEGADPAPRRLQLAVVGRPNAGKSTLVNALTGTDRMLTGPEPGMTRDAISIDWEWQGRPVRLVDTAGLRRRARITLELEQMATQESLRAVRLAHVVVLLVDAVQGLDRQDLTIARHVVDEGRVLILGLNKWDVVTERERVLAEVKDRLEASLAQLRGVPLVTLSALRGERLDRLMATVEASYRLWDRRIPTGPLNRWLAEATGRHPPPLVRGRPNRIRYLTQVKARPPTFAVFMNNPEALPDGYVRYLANDMRDSFGLPGIPVRLLLRRGKNPFAPAGG